MASSNVLAMRKPPKRSETKGRDFSTPAGSKIFIKKMLSKIKRSFEATSEGWAPIAVILARLDPAEPEPLDPPKLIVMPMPEDMVFGKYMGIVSSSAASWKAASLFFVIQGFVVDKEGKKMGHWCSCPQAHGGKRSLLAYFEHENLPRQAWFAEMAEDGKSVGDWQSMPFPPTLTIAFDRVN